MKLKLRIAALGVAASLLLLFAFAPAASAAEPTTNTLTVPESGTTVVQTATGPVTEPVTATFNISHFVNQNGAIWAVGTMTDVAVNGVAQNLPPVAAQQQVQAINGTPIGSSAGAAATNAAAADPNSCTILDLTLGPLHLDLLGLVVDLNQVHLTITAVQGNGNLLGNLLCAVANLLNGTGGSTGGLNLTPITNLLNQILAAL